jgi:hypothetical protein
VEWKKVRFGLDLGDFIDVLGIRASTWCRSGSAAIDKNISDTVVSPSVKTTFVGEI